MGEYIPQYIGEKIAEYIEAPKTLSLVIAATYIISGLISCFILNNVIKSNDEEVLKLITADVHDTIRREINQSIMVSRTMANDNFLKQNLRQENFFPRDTEISLMKDYLYGIKKNFNYDIAFVISAASKNYYYDGGFNKVIDIENNPYDIWYKNFLDKNTPYDVNIDLSEFDKKSWGLFINARIEDNGELIGVCGVGLSMKDLQTVLSEKENRHKVKIDIFQPKENFNVNTDAVKFKDPHLKEILVSLQQQEDFAAKEFIIDEFDDVFVIAKYLSEFDSFLIIRRENSYVQGIFSDLVLKVLIYSGVVLFVLIIFIQVKIGKDHKKLKEESKRQGITSHADKYATMHLIDLKYNSAREVIRYENFNLVNIRDGGNAARKIRNALLTTTKYETLRGLLEFINFDDLPERMKGKRAISYEFLSKEYGWCRANFLLLDDSGKADSNQIVFAIEVIDAEKRRAEELKKRSETDAMTGLRNRGSGEKAITELVANGVEGMFCLMDADKFKSINDNYGHDVGDKVIRAIANALKRTFRNNDVVMRLGGDEYAVYAVGVVDEERGANVIRRLFKEIDDIYIAELGDRKISISLGSAIFHAEEKLSFAELYKRADLATYESKKIQGNFHTAFSKELGEREE